MRRIAKPSNLRKPRRCTGVAALFALLTVAGSISATAGSIRQAGDRTEPTRPGTIELVILHFDASDPELTAAAHQDLLTALPSATDAIVAVAAKGDIARFREAVTLPEDRWRRIRFVETDSPLSIWARDRYIIHRGTRGSTLLHPPETTVVAARSGDLVAGTRVADLVSGLAAQEMPVAIEGGDVLVGRSLALVSNSTLADNAELLGLEADAVLAHLTACLGKRVVAVGRSAKEAPHPHLDMYVALLDDHTVLVGDPRLALQNWAETTKQWSESEVFRLSEPPTRSEQLALVPVYDRVVSELRRLGLRVIRVPALHASDLLLTWSNALIETRGGRGQAYVPAYGLDALDRLAHARWRTAGFDVHPIDVTGCIASGGAVRCLTNAVLGHTRAAPVNPTPASRAPKEANSTTLR